MRIETLVEDIYSTLENKHKLSEDNLSSFLKGMEKAVRDSIENERDQKARPYLRMSSIGKPLRRLWMEFKKQMFSIKAQCLLNFCMVLS